jgi:hypothetical protein
MSKTISVKMTEQELAAAVSALLFSSSVNVVSNTNEEFQNELFSLAEKLKKQKPDLSLENIQFLKEENYEDTLSEKILESFSPNIKQIVNFDSFE